MPILRDVLGFQIETSVKVSSRGRTIWPDYCLFADSETKREAQELRQDQASYYARASAIAEAKRWGRSLDIKSSDPKYDHSNANPSFQIVNYLISTSVQWGILTNGKLWRVYYAGARSRIDTYFEVDLCGILEAQDAEAFHLFYILFSADALQISPLTETCFLEDLYRGSLDYGQVLEQQLRDRIFEKVFLHISEGFVKWDEGTNGVSIGCSPDYMGHVYHGTIRLLYRLLFLLHAEARLLLPVGDMLGYYRYSLLRIARDVDERIHRGETLSGVSTDIWDDLEGLFRIIDRGDPGLNIPSYNGGLFHAKNPSNRFLNNHRIADDCMARAISLLTREPGVSQSEHIAGRLIDYKSLSVEQLGSIYEGLLEFHLVRAENDIPLKEIPQGTILKPTDSGYKSQRSIKKDELFLATDKSVRQATGSYYTPQHIVTFLVEHTLTPLIEVRADSFRRLMAKYQELRLDQISAGENSTSKRGKATSYIDSEPVQWSTEEIDVLKKQIVDSLLGIRICDPAMGSGHFLVHAVDWLSEHLISVLDEFPDNPVLDLIEDTRSRIVDEMVEQGIRINLSDLKDTTLLKRLVMKRCVYGVDLNPMATELAKLSLWLDSFIIGAPLSFLDHHLKTGNSLIGVRISETADALEADQHTGQFHLFAGPFRDLLTATGLMRNVALRSDATTLEVLQSQEEYSLFEEQIAPYKTLLDLWCSRLFGNENVEKLVRVLDLEQLREEPNNDFDGKLKKAISVSSDLSDRLRFFHWELEFPEVFVDLDKGEWRENPGFEAVFGNPPYDELSEDALGRPIEEMMFIDSTPVFAEASEYRVNLYRLFMAASIDKTRVNGTQSFIVPMSLLGDRFTKSLRRGILQSWQFLCIEVFPQKDNPHKRVFRDAKLPTCLYTLSKRAPTKRFRVRTHPGGVIELDSPSYSTTAEEIIELDPQNYVIPIISDDEWSLYQKLAFAKHLVPLGEIAKPMSGEVVFNKAFRRYLSDDPKQVLVLRGGHVQRYELIDNPKQGSPVYIDLDKWLAHSNEGTASFAHTRERIVYQESSALDNWRRIIATFLPAGHVCGHTICYFKDIEYDPFAFLAIFNSSLLEWRFNVVSMTNHLSAYQIEPIPIPSIQFGTPEKKRQSLHLKAKSLFKRLLEQGDASGLSNFVEAQLKPGIQSTDVLHDLLAFLARKMLSLNEQKQEIEKAYDLFKVFDRDSTMVKLSEALAQEIKLGQRVPPIMSDQLCALIDTSIDHHDVDRLQLVELGKSRWELKARLKLLDPKEGWRNWLYTDESESNVLRTWVPVYHIRMDDNKGRFYHFALNALQDFKRFRSYPSGYTRTALMKIHSIPVPRFDPAVNTSMLAELSQELQEVLNSLRRTDLFIDEVVFKMYGLNQDEIGTVMDRIKL